MDKEYIEREALYREVTEKYCDIVAGSYPFNIVAYDMAQLVKSAPAADVVEVVRCKDCVNYCGFERCNNGICDVDPVSKRAVCPTDFCSYGERKENNG